MNKRKMNTVLFIIGATIFNIFMMMVLLTVGIAVLSMAVDQESNQNLVQILMVLIFIGAIAGAFFIYHRAVKLLSKKIDMDRYFHPLFGAKRGKK
jgi:ABC-type Na+ efflux pump permease subunit